MSDLSSRSLTEETPVWRCVNVTQRVGSNPHDACVFEVAEEVPLALVYNGFSHAVMMGTPRDLEDFAIGFSVTEGFALNTADVRDVEVRTRREGIDLAITLTPDALHRFLGRRRARSLRGHTSCGICGIEELEDIASTPIRPVRAVPPAAPAAIQKAVGAIREFQPLSRRTHGAHAAAWIAPDGAVVFAREDVGRHNALDKLIGAGCRRDEDFSAGFCLVTSRCSFEMAQKAIAAGMSVLVAVSAPTGLAIRTAQEAGLTLITLGRAGDDLIYAAPTNQFDPARSEP